MCVIVCSGRKLNCIVFGVIYSLACITKLFNSYWVLMVGRLLSGVATSILFSAFEAWMVSKHIKVRWRLLFCGLSCICDCWDQVQLCLCFLTSHWFLIRYR